MGRARTKERQMRGGWMAVLWMAGCASVSPVPTDPPVVEQPHDGSSDAAPSSDGMTGLGLDFRGLEFGSERPQPVVVALHGRGDHPTRFGQLAERWASVAHVVVPAATIPHHRGFSWFNIRASQDDSTLAAAVSEATRRVVQLVHARRSAEHPVVVTGFSQGGMLSFALATRPDKVVDAAIPMGGFLPRGMWPEARPAHATPIIAVHGESDAVIPVSAPQATVAHLQALDWPVQLHTEPGIGHTISPTMISVVDDAIRTGITPP